MATREFVCVSGYWPVTNKHDNKYDEWFENTLSINCMYVFFTSEKNIPYIEKFRKGRPTVYVAYDIENFQTYKYIDKIVTHPVHCPSKELGLIWHEKIFMMQIAASIIDVNYYMWMDAGICVFRDNKPPSCIFPNKVLDLPPDKFIYSSSSPYYEEFVANNIYYHHVSGTFILHKDIIDKFVSLYRDKLEKVLDHYNIWTEQVIFTHIFKDNKTDFFKLCDGYGEIANYLYRPNEPMSICAGGGGIGNRIFRAIAMTQICEKHNLKAFYESGQIIEQLGIKLFSGDKVYERVLEVKDDNYFDLLNLDNVEFNVGCAGAYFQSSAISKQTWEYINKYSKTVIEANKYKDRYNNNSDCFIHIRLGDVAPYTPGFVYYDTVLSSIECDRIFISSDSPDHEIVTKLIEKYKNAILYKAGTIDVFMFASTCKHIILSNGTFSAIIGYLAYFSNLHYITRTDKNCWDIQYGDLFTTFRSESTKTGACKTWNIE